MTGPTSLPDTFVVGETTDPNVRKIYTVVDIQIYAVYKDTDTDTDTNTYCVQDTSETRGEYEMWARGALFSQAHLDAFRHMVATRASPEDAVVIREFAVGGGVALIDIAGDKTKARRRMTTTYAPDACNEWKIVEITSELVN